MAHIEFLDETLRDGNQSLWGLRMKAGMALPITPALDRTGFRVIDLTGSTAFEVLIRYCQENPWEGLDLLVASMPHTPIRGGMRSNAAVTFATTPDALMDAWMRNWLTVMVAEVSGYTTFCTTSTKCTGSPKSPRSLVRRSQVR